MPVRTVHAVLAQQLGGTWRRAVPRLRRRAGRRGEHRPGAPRHLAGRPGRRRQDPVPGRGDRADGRPQPAGPLRPAVRRAVPRHGRQAADRRAQGAGGRGAGLRRWRPTRSAAFAAAYAGDDADRRPPGGGQRAEGDRLRVARGHAAVADHRRRHPGAARPRRASCWRCCTSPARSGPGCCTPTRTRATSGCCADGRLGVIDFGATARLPDGHPEPIGRLLRWALAGRADEVLADLRAEGFVRPNMEVDAQGVLDYLRPLLEPLVTDRFHFTRAWMQEQAGPDRRPAQRRQPAGPPAEPAAGLPADPPGDDRLDRRALPARRRRQLPRRPRGMAPRLRGARLCSCGAGRCPWPGPSCRADRSCPSRDPEAPRGATRLRGRDGTCAAVCVRAGRTVSTRRRWPARRAATPAPPGGPHRRARYSRRAAGGLGWPRHPRPCGSGPGPARSGTWRVLQVRRRRAAPGGRASGDGAPAERAPHGGRAGVRGGLTRPPSGPCGDVPAAACAR